MAPRRSTPTLVGLVVGGAATLLCRQVGFVPVDIARQPPAHFSRQSWGLQGDVSETRVSLKAVGTADEDQVEQIRTKHQANMAVLEQLQKAAAQAGQAGMVRQPAETYMALAEKGEANAKKPLIKTLHQSIVSGCYVAFAGLLSLSIAGNLGAVATVAPGVQKMVFAALFPVNLLLILNSGGQLFTGNTATVPMAVFEGKATLMELVKSWVVSILGNIIGCAGFALAAKKGGLLVGGVQNLAVAMTMMKTSIPLGQILIKAIMCNWMVCMAVFLSEAARDLGGKMVGIWFPISAFVAMGMEHSVANMFLLPAGILSGAPITIAKMVVRNWIPVAIGNAIAGTVCVAASYSYAFGALGK